MKARRVWSCEPAGLFETEWLKMLLEIDGYEWEDVVLTETFEPMARDLLIFNHSIDYELLLARYEVDHRSFGVIHLSDETLGDTMYYLKYDTCVFACRNYYHPVLSAHPKVMTLGLGWKQGTPSMVDVATKSRYYHWCFAGNIHTADRIQAIMPFASLIPYQLHTTHGSFADPSGLPFHRYIQTMCDSKFAVCPVGQGNIESFRLYEALECGTIPVVLEGTAVQPDYWKSLFPEFESVPWITAGTWNECVDIVRHILQDQNTYIQIQKECEDFWRHMKQKWSYDLQELVGRLVGSPK